jgi:hypothetical protein
MDRERANLVAVVAFIAGLCGLVGAFWYSSWQSNKASVADFSNAFTRDVSNGMIAGSSEAPPTWPTLVLAIVGGVLVLLSLVLWVASYVSKPATEPPPATPSV